VIQVTFTQFTVALRACKAIGTCAVMVIILLRGYTTILRLEMMQYQYHYTSLAGSLILVFTTGCLPQIYI